MFYIAEPDDLIEELTNKDVPEKIVIHEDSDDEIPLNIRLPARYRKRNTKADDGSGS